MAEKLPEPFKILLDQIFEEFAAKEEVPTPGALFNEMNCRIARLVPQEVIAVIARDHPGELAKADPLLQAADLYAVRLVYRARPGRRRRGRPKCNADDSARAIAFRERGLSYAQIAEQLGLPMRTPEEKAKAKDVVRHRIKTAQKRRGQQRQ